MFASGSTIQAKLPSENGSSIPSRIPTQLLSHEQQMEDNDINRQKLRVGGSSLLLHTQEHNDLVVAILVQVFTIDSPSLCMLCAYYPFGSFIHTNTTVKITCLRVCFLPLNGILSNVLLCYVVNCIRSIYSQKY